MREIKTVFILILIITIISGCSSSGGGGNQDDTTPIGLDSSSPSAPQNVSATEQSTTSVIITWTDSTDNVGVEGYRIYRDTALVATTTTPSCSDTDLTPGVITTYTILAYDAAGNESGLSSPLLVQTDLGEESSLVSLTVKDYSGTLRVNDNVRSGVPFPKGSLLVTDALMMKDEASILPLQTRTLSTWDDGSVRWLLLDTQLSLDSNGSCELVLSKVEQEATIDTPVTATENEDYITVTTGKLTVEIPKKNGGLINRLWSGSTLMIDAPDTSDPDRGPWLTIDGESYYGQQLKDDSAVLSTDPVSRYKSYVSSNGGNFNLFDPWDLSVTIEESGPLHVVVRVSGAHLNEAGLGFSSFVTRIHAYRDSARLTVDHTLIFTGNGNDEIDGYGITMPFEGAQTMIEGVEIATGSVLQTSYDDYSVSGTDYQGQADGYVVRSGDSGTLAVVLKDMAENFPKAIVATENSINVQLYPEAIAALNVARYSGSIDTANGESGGDSNRAAQGFSKTETVIFDFSAEANPITIAKQVDSMPLMALAQPDWYSDAGVMGVGDFVFNSASDNSEALYRIDRKLKVIADFMRYNQREKFDWFGMMDYGDIRGLFNGGCNSDTDDCTWSELGRYGWSGNSGEPSNQLWIQFLRTLEPDAYTDAVALAKHTQGVQMIHYGDATEHNDQTISGGRNREFSVGSLHRHGRQAWSGYGQAPEYSHVAGIETFYYLTGDGRAKESLYEAATFIKRYGTDNEEYTALVNGIDTLSRAAAVFYNTNEIYTGFNNRITQLLDFLTPNGVTNELSGSSLNGTFGFFVRGAPGLLYHHERTQSSQVADLIFSAADYITGGGSGDRWGVGTDAEAGSVWYYLNSLTYAASIAGQYGKSNDAYKTLAETVMTLNTHTQADSGTYAISLASFDAVPDDWTQWVWQWAEGDLNPTEPELLYIARQMTFRNNYMQDYHSYRAFIHLATAAALSEGSK